MSRCNTSSTIKTSLKTKSRFDVGVTLGIVMDKGKIIAILENEIACVKAGATCDRQCEKCQLVRDEADIISALRYAIASIYEAKG